jgi:hypothetical protein
MVTLSLATLERAVSAMIGFLLLFFCFVAMEKDILRTSVNSAGMLMSIGYGEYAARSLDCFEGTQFAACWVPVHLAAIWSRVSSKGTDHWDSTVVRYALSL